MTTLIIAMAVQFCLIMLMAGVFFFTWRRGAVNIGKEEVLVVTRLNNRRPLVRFTSTAFGWPGAPEVIPLAPIVVTVVRAGRESLHTSDNQRVEVTVEFTFRIDPAQAAIVRAAQHLGGDNLRSPEFMAQLFTGKCSEALIAVVRSFKGAALSTSTEKLMEALQSYIGADLNGFAITAVNPVHIRVAQESAYDRGNILDLKWLTRKSN
ncbi:hypothetical protein KKF84_03910 [Myxococcota bacterium]|nr:hypothetical protein [Myxococcota bacterium]